jgi:uncharacterized ParB-like nuclease family protein
MTRIAYLFAISALLASAATYTGVITDSMCGNDHKAMNMGPDPECIRKCVKSGKTVKYVLFDGKNTYKLSDQETPEKFAARRVKITGTLFEKTGVISVEKIEPVR